jgi:diaminopropionate ammonia-lyase
MDEPTDIAGLFDRLWPGQAPTPLVELPQLARLCGVARVIVKDESRRPLGNFKSLGGTYAALNALAREMGEPTIAALLDADRAPRALPRLICASAGNHGLAVAAAAEKAGTAARIYLYPGVSEVRVQRLADRGAELVWVAGGYDDAVEAAARAAAAGDGLLIADISERTDDPALADVMAGYDLIGEEIAHQAPALDGPPTHLFVQAGVGGLAGALAQGLRERLSPPPRIVVVEPAAARCVAAGLAAGRPVRLDGDPSSTAAMLACGQASAPALEMLLRQQALAIGVDEAQLADAVRALAEAGGPATTPSGATGLAGLMAARPGSAAAADLGLTAQSVVLLIVTEGPA